MKKPLIIGLAAGLAVLVLAGFWFFREQPKLDASLAVPAEVALGSKASMVVTITNPHKQSVTLDSIDVDDSFLAGFQVLSVEPKPKEIMHVPVVNQRSWGFGRKVPPQGTLSVTFTLKAVAEGRFTGDVDACNPSQNFTTQVADVVVTGKPDAPGRRFR